MESVMLMDDGYKMSAREVQDEWENDIRMWKMTELKTTLSVK